MYVCVYIYIYVCVCVCVCVCMCVYMFRYFFTLFVTWSITQILCLLESSRDIVANMLDCNITVSEFELQSRYYVYFRTNALGNLFFLSNLLNSPTTVQGWLWHEITQEV